MADELNNVQEQEQVSAKALIALTKKSGGNKVLVESMEGYTKGYNIDGVYVTDGINAVIVSLTEQELPFGGASEDLHEGDPLYDVASPSMTSFDGEWRTDFLISFFGYGDGTALVEARKVGWLPSGGELSLLSANREAVNGKLEAAGGTPLGEGAYWSSQKFSNERMWSCMMGENKFTLNYGCITALAVRPVKSAEGYSEAK
jgi:hypothetical protein